MDGAGHLQQLLVLLLEHAAAGDEGGVGGAAARGGGVPEVARAGGKQPLGIGLEQMDGIERAGTQGGLVLLHACGRR